MLTKALILFVDIRGFTMWSGDPDVHDNVVEFVNRFDEMLAEHFSGYYRKLLGDGAMLVRELDQERAQSPQVVAEEVLALITATDEQFAMHCDEFYTRHGAKTTLHLGWGVTRGDVWRIRVDGRDDYLGRNINEAARLCHQARPYGVVMDSDDFRALPTAHAPRFTLQQFNLFGFNHRVQAWVTPEIAKALQPRGYHREQPEVFVNGVCVREDRGELEVLVMKRSYRREFFPGLLEITTSGQLAKDESFLQGVTRHFDRELGIQVAVDEQQFLLYQFGNRDGELIPGIRYLCWYVKGQPHLANYEEFHWMPVAKLEATPTEEFLPGAKEDVLRMLRALQRDRLQPEVAAAAK